MSFTKLSQGGNILYMTSLFPLRESLEIDIPAGDSIFKSFFYGVVQVLSKIYVKNIVYNVPTTVSKINQKGKEVARFQVF